MEGILPCCSEWCHVPGMQHCHTPAHGLGDNWILGPGQEGVGTSTAAPVFFFTSKEQTIEFYNNEKEKRSQMMMTAKAAT